MTRPQEQTWLIIAVAIFVHACLLGAMLVGLWKFGGEPSPETAAVLPVTTEPPQKSQPLPAPTKVDDQQLGERTGEGDSVAHVDLPDVVESNHPEDIEQAWTRQHPQFSPPSQRPADQTAPHADAANADAEKSQQQPFGPPDTIEGLLSVAVPRHAQLEHPPTEAEVAEKTVVAAPAAPAPPESKTPAEAKPQAAAEQTRPPDPAAAGASDLDPFAKQESVDFTPGGIKSRTGREVKLVRPRVDLGFMSEATRLTGHDLSVRLLIATDDTGRPRDVVVAESSGSAVIDDAVRLALFDSWFGGKMPDSFSFTVKVRR